MQTDKIKLISVVRPQKCHLSRFLNSKSRASYSTAQLNCTFAAIRISQHCILAVQQKKSLPYARARCQSLQEPLSSLFSI
ncbi:hypothetical protein CR158_16025 [Halomonas heilongjiangensis]|nr:hypothetical protein CR158_16025 [Halomonas heilongjiangensis]